MHVATSITADDTVRALDRLARERGAPAHVRCDNGPELSAHALRDWCRFRRAETAFIEPGAPWQNPFVESFNGRVRDELLDVEQFSGLAEARVVIEDWREDSNHHRPHSALAMKAPAVFAASWTPGPASAPRPGAAALGPTDLAARHSAADLEGVRWRRIRPTSPSSPRTSPRRVACDVAGNELQMRRRRQLLARLRQRARPARRAASCVGSQH
jgi:hypothetical protein